MTDRILVVDDDALALRLMKLSLEGEGFQVSTATNAFEALRASQTERPNLIVLDIMMPDVDGLQVLHHLRSQPATRGIPVVFLTAKVQLEDRIAGLRAGADDYITKPADPREVVARVQALLQRSRHTSTPRQGRVVAVIGAKGGVGTSTITLNLAASFVKRQVSSVLIDLRPNAGSIACQLKSAQRSSLADLIALPAEQLDSLHVEKCLIQHSSGLRLLLSPPSGAKLSELPATHVGPLARASAALADVVFLDLPHVASPASTEALRSSQRALLVLAPAAVTMACAEQALSLLESCGLTGEQVAMVVVNRSPVSMALSVSEIERKLHTTCLGLVPPAQEELAVSEAHGMPLVLSTSHTMATMALQEMSERVKTWVLAETLQ